MTAPASPVEDVEDEESSESSAQVEEGGSMPTVESGEGGGAVAETGVEEERGVLRGGGVGEGRLTVSLRVEADATRTEERSSGSVVDAVKGSGPERVTEIAVVVGSG